MKFFLLSALIWSAWTLVLLAGAGYLLAKFGLVNRKNARRSGLLAASLVAVCGAALTQRSSFPLEYAVADVVAWFSGAWLASFGAFWLGLTMVGVKDDSHHDFGESSMLSMQYLDSVEHPRAPTSDFQQTVDLSDDAVLHAPPSGRSDASTSSGHHPPGARG